MQKVLVAFVLLWFTLPLHAQELDCRVQVVHNQIQGTQDQLYNAMRKDIFEFMNNKKWTEHVYNPNERIECNILINLTKRVGSEKFIGTIQVQSRRPVYNTNYTTVLLNYQEKKNNFHFRYIEDQALEFSENAHLSNLTSVLAFYAYVIIGLDYDTFGEESGTRYYQKAQQIVNNAQNSSDPGWKAFEDTKNRYWLVENLQDETYSGIRKCLYEYHRKGLDMMADNTTKGRANVANSLEYLKQVHQRKPSSFLMQLFLDAKGDEIQKVFSESYATEAKKVFDVMQLIDPAGAGDYEKILQQ